MNIFVTNRCPLKSASNLFDYGHRRAIKMILESAQILCTALHLKGYKDKWFYKPTHINHPCVLWAAKNECNFQWLLHHASELSRIYTTIYNRQHKSELILLRIPKDVNATFDKIEFVNCARSSTKSLDFTNEIDITAAYEKYLTAQNKIK